jgi:hypothetical protein
VNFVLFFEQKGKFLAAEKFALLPVLLKHGSREALLAASV